MTPRRATALLLTFAALLLVGCGEDDSSDSGSGQGASAAPAAEAPAGSEPAPSGEAVRSAKVEIADFEFEPATVTIQAGGKVTWLNRDSAAHTATLDDGSFDSGALAEGKLRSQSFKDPGTFAYHCEIHPEMKGTVEVVEG